MTPPLFQPVSGRRCTRRQLLAAASAGSLLAATSPAGLATAAGPDNPGAQIAITLDLEMSRDYPRRGMREWDFQKGNLDDATKQYALEAAKLVKQRGGVIHFFCVGRVLEQADVSWLQEIAQQGHPVGNHTYDHVNVLAKTAADTQFRFQRSPWLVAGKTAADVIRENIHLTRVALRERAKIDEQGFRTPGGFYQGLADRPDVQQLLLDAGYRWISSKYPRHQSGTPKEPPAAEVYADIVRAQREAQPFRYASGLIEIPMSPISDVTAFRSHYWKLPQFLKAVRLAVEWAIEEQAVFDFLAHPSCLVVEDPKFETLQLICDLVQHAAKPATLCGLGQIARRVEA